MNAQQIITGLQIIDDHRPSDQSPLHVRAEHDNIYAGNLEWPMSQLVQNRLEELGWERNESINGWCY